MAYQFNPFTGSLDPVFKPLFITGSNTLPSGASFLLAANQQMLAINIFYLQGDLTLAGDFMVL